MRTRTGNRSVIYDRDYQGGYLFRSSENPLRIQLKAIENNEFAPIDLEIVGRAPLSDSCTLYFSNHADLPESQPDLLSIRFVDFFDKSDSIFGPRDIEFSFPVKSSRYGAVQFGEFKFSYLIPPPKPESEIDVFNFFHSSASFLEGALAQEAAMEQSARQSCRSGTLFFEKGDSTGGCKLVCFYTSLSKPCQAELFQQVLANIEERREFLRMYHQKIHAALIEALPMWEALEEAYRELPPPRGTTE